MGLGCTGGSSEPPGWTKEDMAAQASSHRGSSEPAGWTKDDMARRASSHRKGLDCTGGSSDEPAGWTKDDMARRPHIVRGSGSEFLLRPLPLPYYMASSTLRPDSRDTLSANHVSQRKSSTHSTLNIYELR
ncbi:hypothetical protein Bbelb_076850 [Branchiostoma belcheri]|nr:hypothetical protein Bbelb_076850 [Branchiostoma belcheri]